MGYNFLSIEVDEGVGIIKLNRPPANSLNEDFTAELGKAFDEVKENDEIKVVMIKSELPGFFIAGADIKMFAQMTPEQGKQVSRDLQAVIDKLENMEKISIAVISGFALGGGLEVALGCDFRFACKKVKIKDKERDVMIGLPETNLGLLPGAGGTQRLSRIIGPKKALYFISQGAQMSVEQAYSLGIIEEIYETPEELFDASLKFAKMIAKRAIKAIGYAKYAIYKGFNKDLKEALEIESEMFYKAFQTEDCKEGLNAFIEKRKPEFKGR